MFSEFGLPETVGFYSCTCQVRLGPAGPPFLCGVLIFIIGQIFVEAILKPYKRYKELKAKISYALVMYANVYSNPLIWEKSSISDREKYEAVGNELRELASELTGYIEERWSVPGRANSMNISRAASALIGLSNTLIVREMNMNRVFEENDKRVETIRKALKIQSDI